LIALIVLVFAGYLLGSVPCSYLVARSHQRLDLRRVGSGNVGATNVGRALGWKAGAAALTGDISKGAGAAVMGLWVTASLGSAPEYLPLAVGFAAIAGHNWSPFLRFRGGKGVATSSGVVLVLAPVPFLGSLGVLSAVVGLTRYVSLGSVCAAGLLPVFLWSWPASRSLPHVVFGGLVAGVILVRHRSNLKRLWHGTESRLGERIQVS
jgi:glycerol-3-phosphate acyltransferase PlsY